MLRLVAEVTGNLDALKTVGRGLVIGLAANLLAGHFLLAVFFLGTIALLQSGILAIVGVFAFVLSVVLVGFEIFVSILQAFIFAILTASYIGGAMAEEH